MMERLMANTDIDTVSPGSVVRSLLEIINDQFEETYKYLEAYIPMAFLSTAQNEYVDLLGSLFNCTRYTDESDEDFKYRISNYVYSTAGANETAIYLACRSIEGVKDVFIAPYVYGIGSFAVYVVTDDPNVPDDIVNNVQTAINDTKAFGIVGVAERPTVRRLSITYQLNFGSTVTTDELTNIVRQVNNQIKLNIDNSVIGNTFYLNNVLLNVVSISSKITNIDLVDVKLDNKTVYSKTITLAAGEKLYAGDINSN
jgi:uncharacterized phage protein gp47/JayE